MFLSGVLTAQFSVKINLFQCAFVLFVFIIYLQAASGRNILVPKPGNLGLEIPLNHVFSQCLSSQTPVVASWHLLKTPATSLSNSLPSRHR